MPGGFGAVFQVGVRAGWSGVLATPASPPRAGKGTHPLTFLDPGCTSAGTDRMDVGGGGGSRTSGKRGFGRRRLQETKTLARARGHGPAPLGSLCGHVHLAFGGPGLRAFGFRDLPLLPIVGGGGSVGLGCIEPCCLVSRARLGGCGAGGARLVSCVRVRGLLPVDVSGSGLRAACAGSRARHRHPTPRLLAPLLAVRPPGRPPPPPDLTWLQTFFSRFLGQPTNRPGPPLSPAAVRTRNWTD